jgi:hypothetical protein
MTDPIPPRPSDSALIAAVSTVVETMKEVIVGLQNEVRILASTEKNSRRRTQIVLVVFALFLFLGAQQLRDTKKIVNYISDCQDPNGECKKRNDAAIAGAVIQIGKLVFDSQVCVQRVPLAERTDDKIAECRTQYFGR